MKMQSIRRAVLLAAASLAVAVPLVWVSPAEAQWVFVARKAAQRIHHMREEGQGGQPGYDFASVILEAPADKVYAVALLATALSFLIYSFVHWLGRRLDWR